MELRTRSEGTGTENENAPKDKDRTSENMKGKNGECLNGAD